MNLLVVVPGLLLLALVQGCASPGGSGGSSQSSRYAQTQDAAPLKSIGPDDVADAIPSAEPILAAGNKSPYRVNGVSYSVLKDATNYKERGTASWYGSKFHGHQTSNGEIFDLYLATAAHKTLPIPSFVRVTNLGNGRSVVVRVNDRGPFHGDRLIDLSYGAAVKLGYMGQGTAQVEVELISVVGADDRRAAPVGEYRYLQVGAFASSVSAQKMQSKLVDLVNAPVAVSAVDAAGAVLYRVRVGPVDSRDHLAAVQRQLVAGGYPAGQPLP